MTEIFRCNFRHKSMSRHRHTLVAIFCMQWLLQRDGHTLCHDIKCVFQVAPTKGTKFLCVFCSNPVIPRIPVSYTSLMG